MKKRILLGISILLMAVLAVNLQYAPSQAAKKNVKSVKLNYTEYTLKKGKKLKLKATISPKKAKKSKIVWKSSKKKIATVTQKGVVKAKKNGKVTIKATVKGTKKKAVCKITVGTPVQSVTAATSRISLKVGEQMKVQTTVAPKKASNKKLIWTSSDDKVVKVNNGTITAIQAGTATVTAKAVDGSGKKAVIRVEVTANTSADSGTKTENKSDNKTETKPENPVISVQNVELSQTTATLFVNDTVTLNATITPANATNKNVTWKSSRPTVASVSNNGAVKALAKGETVISVTTADGNKLAQCKVTVQDGISISSFSELDSALQGGYEIVSLKTTETGKFEIKGDYADVTLIVDAPNATVTNTGTFKKIQINAISENTWIENAQNNYLDLNASKAHIIVGGSVAGLEINSGSKNIAVENNGTISRIAINAAATLDITGTNRTKIPVQSDATGAMIKTSIPLTVDATKEFAFHVRSGAETSTISIVNESASPTIEGLGIISVTNKETNTVNDVVAENTESVSSGETQKGIVTGTIQNKDGSALSGAKVYVIPYLSSIEESAIGTAIEQAKADGRCYEVASDATGKYTISGVPYGNYLLVAKADKLSDYLLAVVLGQETVTNETITMTEPSEQKGTIQGTLHDAYDNSTVPEGITLILRRNHNNTFGVAVSTTKTDKNGSYSFADIAEGNYTIQVVDNRTLIAAGTNLYVRMSFNVTITGGETTEKNMTISQEITDTQIRFVLTWGKEKETVSSDLDSHLVGPQYDGEGKFHTYFDDMSYGYDESGNYYAALDVDDTNYEGPETTTIYKASDGEYHFYVYDYTNQDNQSNTILSTSEAVVKVYRGEQNVATYAVPSGTGTLWDVCTYNIKTNTLKPINKITYHPGTSSNVGLSALEIAQNQLLETIDTYNGIQYGDAVQKDAEAKLAAAKQSIKEEKDADKLLAMQEELESYFRTLERSTVINEISSTNIKRYSITRRNEYNEDEDQRQSKAYSVIWLQVKDSSKDLTDAQIELADKNAKYEIKTSDKNEYKYLIEVTNSTTKASEKYYVAYKEFLPSLYPTNVSEEGNYITHTGWVDIDEEGNNYYYCSGENETLEKPVFTFEDDDITYEYAKASEEDKEYAGVLTVKYKDKTQVIPVKYEQILRDIYLQYVKENDEEIVCDDDWHFDDDDNEYKVYQVSGDAAELGEAFQFGFNVENVTYKVVKEDGKFWNYKIVVTYKGEEQVLYIQYDQKNANE